MQISFLKVMNVFAIILFISTFSAWVLAAQEDEYDQFTINDEAPMLRRSLKGGGGSSMSTFFSVLNAAQDPMCNSSALGNAVATYDSSNMMFCLYLGYQGLSGPETPPASGAGSSHIHGPSAIGTAAPILIKLNTTNPKTECHSMTKQEEGYLHKQMLYFNIHTVKCPNGEIRGQILMAA